jgi:hypothetical protein
MELYLHCEVFTSWWFIPEHRDNFTKIVVSQFMFANFAGDVTASRDDF